MSLPPGFLDELRNRVSLSAVVGRKVTWDMRKSNMAKGDWWSPCPFHQEKSASFHVDDRKGFYYCFGCHAKGDALTFIKESENLGFMEAVAVLASEAGMQMPERDPKAAAIADKRSQLSEVMEEAVRWFRLQLKTQAAADARAYLAKRGLSEAAQGRWEIGFAPDGWSGLFQAMTGKGIAKELLVEAGLCATSSKGKEPYDRFRNRIIFPIRDGRGRAISLGGRAMDPNDPAKYLNGPETELFDKGRNLFNHGPAREAAGKGQTLIVGEGYMDVIALSEAGFQAAVAPLGTAVTEDQLRLLWRISHEPVIALDGDKAGIRAALRVIDLALPLLEAGKGLRFAMMPEGMDPDDLIRAKGPEAVAAVIQDAQPMVRLLWNRETEGQVFDSPERKAALDKKLREALKRIQDPSIRAHYGEDIKELRWELFRQGRRPAQRTPGRPWQPGPRGQMRGGKFVPPPLPATDATRNSALAGHEADLLYPSRISDGIREAVALAILMRFPALISRFESDLERLELSNETHFRLRNLILTHAHADDCRALIESDSPGLLDELMRSNHVRSNPGLQPKADADFAAACVEEALARLQADRGHRIELAEAVEDLSGLVDEGLTWRLSKAAEARVAASRGPQEQKTESVIAPNGVELDREELERRHKLFDSIDFSAGGKARRD
ncbi:DNA primase [Xinfangfangia sp. D13-10-4-6]|uniref:DNA primase n=1 Tax=Pseudogemmobacter hezensis TaxID=2737662 RepID=UPI001555D8F0|nr:DNA primase [Pseudogemmobacter hezensis]NPD13641.1 DNA primase [Pseudogemmobacter hezensis]